MNTAERFYADHWLELKREARFYVGSVEDADAKIADALASAWQVWSAHSEWHDRKDRLFSCLWWAAKQVRAGRRRQGSRRRRRDAFRLSREPAFLAIDRACSRETDPAILAQVRLDFQAWIETIGERSRQRVLARIDGAKLSQLASDAGVSRNTMRRRLELLRDKLEAFLAE